MDQIVDVHNFHHLSLKLINLTSEEKYDVYIGFNELNLEHQRPVGLYSSALLFCAVALDVLLKSGPVSEGMRALDVVLKSGPVSEGMSPQHWQINGGKHFPGTCTCNQVHAVKLSAI